MRVPEPVVEHAEGECRSVGLEGVVHLVRGLIDFEAGVGIKWGGGEGVPALDYLGSVGVEGVVFGGVCVDGGCEWVYACVIVHGQVQLLV